MDHGHIQANMMLHELENKINSNYKAAQKKVQKKAEAAMKKFDKKDKEMLKLLKTGKITDAEYLNWRKQSMLVPSYLNDLSDTLAKDLVNADKIATTLVNNRIPDIYAVNANYGVYEISKTLGYDIGGSFSLYDHRTAERLMRRNAGIMKINTDIPKDQQWNKRKIQSSLMRGVLSGDSIPDIAKGLMSVTDMDRKAAIRNARTYTTAAENGGRIDGYKYAKSLGIKIKKEWMATLDTRTRMTHRVLDGEQVEVDAEFSNKLQYPGDPKGDGAEIYNCRCTLVAADAEFEAENAEEAASRYSKLPEGLTYEEWKQGKNVGLIQPDTFSFLDEVNKVLDPNKKVLDITMDDVYRVGELFAREVNENYLNPIKQRYDAASKEFDEAGRTELAQLKGQARQADKLLWKSQWDYRKPDPRDYGFESLDDALALHDKVLDRIKEIEASERYKAAKKNFETAKAEMNNVDGHIAFMKSRLAQVRAVGDYTAREMKYHFDFSRSPMCSIVEEAYGAYPTDWIQKSFKRGSLVPKKVNRGYYDGYNIALSGSNRKSQLITAFHELGHRFEDVVPGIRRMEKQFYDKRTAGEALEWLGCGYARSEKTRRDKFLDSYMGKDYGGQAYELVSMGFQFAFTEPFTLMKDPDMQAWILGLLLYF